MPNVIAVHGFVEELVVRKDPEHGLAELVRSSVASNEERQRVFHKLATEVRRNVGGGPPVGIGEVGVGAVGEKASRGCDIADRCRREESAIGLHLGR